MLRISLTQVPRLLEIERNTHERLGEARRMQWLGEVAALEESLRHIAGKKQQAERLRAERSTARSTSPHWLTASIQAASFYEAIRGSRRMANKYARPVIRWSISVRVADGPIAQISRTHHRQPRLRPVDLDAITLNYVGHRQPRPREELLALTRSDAPLHSGKALISHATQPDAQPMGFRKYTNGFKRTNWPPVRAAR